LAESHYEVKEMKLFYSALVLGLALSPLSHADCSAASKQAALNFINTYIKLSDQGGSNYDKWVANHKALTPNFKTAYKKMIEQGKKEDPELGLGFDPIIDGQDFPDKFDKVKICKPSGVIWVSGSWTPDSKKTMEIAVKPIQKQGKWLIDGSGVINIPEKEQAKR